MVTSEVSKMRGYETDGGCGVDGCFAAKPVPEPISECEQVINKVNSILESLKIPISRYETELNDLKYTFSIFIDRLKQTLLTNSNLNDQLGRVSSKSETRCIWIEKLESDLSKSRDESIYLQRDNLDLLKQCNIFYLIAKRLCFNIT